jgi:uncharacterized protein with PIN domain
VNETRFIADRMLGRLARYMRLLGYDVSYPPPIPDAQLVGMARREGRILLTRDRGITAGSGPRAGNPRVVELVSTEVLEQISQLTAEGWITRAFDPRCSVCNTPLRDIPEWEARHLLPPFTLATQCLFHHCSECNTVFWEGSHWIHFLDRLAPKV